MWSRCAPCCTRRSEPGASCSRVDRSRGRPVASAASARARRRALPGARCRPGHRAVAVRARCRRRRVGPARGTPMSRPRFGAEEVAVPRSAAAVRRRARAVRSARRRDRAAPAVRGVVRARGAARVRRAPGGVGRARRQDRHRCAVRSGGGGRAAVRDRPGRARALVAAARRLDCGAGTVWAGDAQQGFNGSTAYVHWVVDADDAEIAIVQLASRAARGSGSPRSSRGSRAACTGSSPTTGSPCSGPSS